MKSEFQRLVNGPPDPESPDNYEAFLSRSYNFAGVKFHSIRFNETVFWDDHGFRECMEPLSWLGHAKVIIPENTGVFRKYRCFSKLPVLKNRYFLHSLLTLTTIRKTGCKP